MKSWIPKPDVVRGLVEGLLDGNSRVRAAAAPHRKVIARAFKWQEGDVDEAVAGQDEGVRRPPEGPGPADGAPRTVEEAVSRQRSPC